jgi:hypothetical protein
MVIGMGAISAFRRFKPPAKCLNCLSVRFVSRNMKKRNTNLEAATCRSCIERQYRPEDGATTWDFIRVDKRTRAKRVIALFWSQYSF